MQTEVKVLLLADTHLGFDLPARPRVSRRRRGHDFLANYAAALELALAGHVDVVVHAGDVFDRPEIPASLAYQALEPLARVAENGIPVFVVPGNHERSRLPHARFARHKLVHVFDRPRTFTVDVRGMRMAVAGLPCVRRNVREHFPELLERCAWERERACLRLLCLHQCVEGATVGPGDFTFTTAADVIRGRDIPGDFTAVVSGHIHRHQVLTTDLSGKPLAAPVLYPGSIERTSLAEIGEPKGFMIVHLGVGQTGPNVRWEFRPLPARPMIARELNAQRLSTSAFDAAVRAIVAGAPSDAVLRIRVVGELPGTHLRVLTAAHLRTFVPSSMNVEVRASDGSQILRRAPAVPRPSSRRSELANHELELGGAP